MAIRGQCEHAALYAYCSLCNPLEVEEAVIASIRSRRDAGRAKYGTTMERSDLSELQWLRHAQEEALDLAIYLEKLIKQKEANA